MAEKARILFVDDEKRVLNSMRGLFRREFELFLTTEGSDAIRIASENSIDVVVADQRMPGMTGIEVLGKVKELSPKTVRILLTGYADPEAVEGSINIGEVFRFLSKPCPPGTLRDTLKMAVEASRTIAPPPVEKRIEQAPPVAVPTDVRSAVPSSREEPVSTSAATQALPPTLIPVVEDQKHLQPAAPTAFELSVRDESAGTVEPASVVEQTVAEGATSDAMDREADEVEKTPKVATVTSIQDVKADSHWQQSTNIVLSGETSREFPTPDFSSYTSPEFSKVGVVFFTVDPEFAESAMRAASNDRNVTLATTLAKVAETIERKEAGVLVTDFTSNKSVLHRMIGTLKQLLPELVTIVASNGRDTTDMISLINHGQVFRYILKPIDPKKLVYEINAAAIKHLDLAESPGLAMRHQVVNMAGSGGDDESLGTFLTRIRKLHSPKVDPSDSSI